MGLILTVVPMLRESQRKAEARNVVSQVQMAIQQYGQEDPTRSLPPAESDTLVRYDPTNGSFHLLNAVVSMHLDGGVREMMPDPANAGMRILIDPWRRPYHYQLDNAGAANPTLAVAATRPNPAFADWNARGLVPFGYVWSLGSPKLGQPGMMSGDPDALPVNLAPWIYVKTTPTSSP